MSKETNTSSTIPSTSPSKSTNTPNSSPCKVVPSSKSNTGGSGKNNAPAALQSAALICKESPGKSPGKYSASVSSSSSLQSSDSASGRSVEWLVKTPSVDRHPAPYSEETKRQIPAIKALVAQQEAETAAKEKAGGGSPVGTTAGATAPASTEVLPQVSTTFAQDMVYIQEQIRKGREEWERQEAERKAAKKAKKAAKKAAKEKENQVLGKGGGGGGTCGGSPLDDRQAKKPN